MDEALAKSIIETVAFTGSTNSDLIERAEQGAPEGLWLRAKTQAAGRGRNARDWVSPEGNIYTSTIVRLGPNDPPATTLAFVAAVALYDSIYHYVPREDLMIKWPNDIVINHAKICGILLERSDDAVIMGAGVNLVDSPTNIDRKATSIRELGFAPPTPDDFMQILVDNFALWLKRWRDVGFANVRQYWLLKAHPQGQAMQFKDGNSVVVGQFDGLDNDGACIIKGTDGQSYLVHAGDVFLIE